MADAGTNWDLAFVMPNLQLGRSWDFGEIAFVAAHVLLEGFSDQSGQALWPAASIFVSKNSFSDLRGAIVDARNCLALSCVLNGWQLSIGCQSNFLIRDSDYFDFYPRWPSHDGKELVYQGPAFGLISTVGRRFNAQPHAYIRPCHPQLRQPLPDQRLLTNLSRVWSRVHMSAKPRPGDSRILRSLSVAYEASRVPQAMDNPLYDHGKHCSLWVSALETLAHPSRSRVSQKTVLELLGRRKLGERRLAAKRYVRIRKNERLALNQVQRLCVLLYRARNAFLHGNALPLSVFIPPRLGEGVRLLDVGAVLYLTSLEATFGPPRPRRRVRHKTREAQRLDDIFEIMSHNTLEHAFERAVGWRNQIGLPIANKREV
jgi:hypothetical protein